MVTLDDATSAVYSGLLVAEEGTASSLRALAEVIAEHGLFCELYTDRGSHYFHTPEAEESVSKSVQTGCVSRFGSRPVDLWTTLRVAHNPTGPTTTEAVN